MNRANFFRLRISAIFNYTFYFFLFIFYCVEAKAITINNDIIESEQTKTQNTAFPLKISENHRYFIDQNGKPFLYNADTGWKLFVNLTKEEALEYLKIRKKQGFNTIQVILLPMNPITASNQNGDYPFIDEDINNPNESYFDHAKWVIDQAAQMGMLMVCNTMWKGCCGEGWAQKLDTYSNEECRNYGRYLGKKFTSCNNLFWFQGGDNDPKQHTDGFRQIALGIEEYAPHQLQSYHAASTHSSSDVIPATSNTWLDFVMTYTYYHGKSNWVSNLGFGYVPEVYEVNHREYVKIPVRPFFISETMYEGEVYGANADGDNRKEPNDPYVIRRQAYWSVLAGGCGHAYGSWCWRMPSNWRDCENSTAANQMKHLYDIFASVNWHLLKPDMEDEIIIKGAGSYETDDYITTAITDDQSLVIAYIPHTQNVKREITLESSTFTSPMTFYWFDPTSGKYLPAKENSETGPSVIELITPGKNEGGDHDWILLGK